LLSAAIGDAGSAAIERQISANARIWRRGGGKDWASESHKIAVNFIYARWPEPLRCGQPTATPVVITQAYADAAAPIIRQQIARASVRLAMALERALR
jgi:hypothetical protein